MLKFNMDEMHPRDNCWICQVDSQLEEHHIIPRSNGGTNGPLCDLCPICHSSIHKLSYKKIFIEDPESIKYLTDFPNYNKKEIKKAHYLSSVILNARRLTCNEALPVKSSLLLDVKTHVRLKLLAKTLALSQEKTIIYAINNLYIKLIGEIK